MIVATELDSILFGLLNKATHNCMLDLAHELFITKNTFASLSDK
jgi:hypothetical protein